MTKALTALIIIAASLATAFGCKSRTEKVEPAPTTEQVEEKSGGVEEPADEGWGPRPIGGGPAPTIEHTPPPAAAPPPKPARSTAGPTLPGPPTHPEIAPLMGEAIKRIANEESISVLFE